MKRQKIEALSEQIELTIQGSVEYVYEGTTSGKRRRPRRQKSRSQERDCISLQRLKGGETENDDSCGWIHSGGYDVQKGKTDGTQILWEGETRIPLWCAHGAGERGSSCAGSIHTPTGTFAEINRCCAQIVPATLRTHPLCTAKTRRCLVARGRTGSGA